MKPNFIRKNWKKIENALLAVDFFVSINDFSPHDTENRHLSAVWRHYLEHRLLFPLWWGAVWRGKEINSCGASTFSLRQQTSGFEPFGVSTKESGGSSILVGKPKP